MRYARHAIAAGDRPDAAHVTIGVVYAKQGKMTGAGRQVEGVAVLEKAIPLDPDNWWTYCALGYAHFYAGEFADAALWFERVLQLRPNFPEIEERLRTIRSRERDSSQTGPRKHAGAR